MAWPSGMIVRPLVGTLVVVFPLAVGLSLAASVPVGSVTSIIWRFGFALTLMWVEVHRQRLHMFLMNLGISRRRLLGVVMGVYGLFEATLQTAMAILPW